jgi:uncharacterized membrane protein YjjP (DUF1212 family)
MNESETHELQAIREDVKEIRNALTRLQKSSKQRQKVTGFQFVFGLGLSAMVVGMTLTGYQDIIKGVVAFFIGLALCLYILSSILMPRVKNKLNRLTSR